MPDLPRIAVGTLQPGTDLQPMLWAMMDAQRRRDIRVQSFFSRACFPRCKAAEAITELRPRYLDSWLMSEDVCREIFARGGELGDLAVVEGDFSTHLGVANRGGELEPLCQWLRLPRIVVLDAAKIAPSLPDRPEHLDGVFLDRVADNDRLAKLITDVETLWRVPVLGALPEAPRLREAMRGIPSGERPPRDLCRQWGDLLVERWRPEKIDVLARSQPLPEVNHRLFRREVATFKLTVAVAFDEAFHCYFPCSLDLLELRGATIVDFSPLRDESLPPETDIVYIGCGHPERHAAALAANHCMMAALRGHVRWGRRLYAEAGGLAYLCEQMETVDGKMAHMTGVFSAAARLNHHPAEPAPVEVTLNRANWLGRAGNTIRGYRSPSWRLEPLGSLAGFLRPGTHPHDLVGTFEAVGSLLHIDFAAQEAMLNHFFYPHAAKSGS